MVSGLNSFSSVESHQDVFGQALASQNILSGHGGAGDLTVVPPDTTSTVFPGADVPEAISPATFEFYQPAIDSRVSIAGRPAEQFAGTADEAGRIYTYLTDERNILNSQGAEQSVIDGHSKDVGKANQAFVDLEDAYKFNTINGWGGEAFKKWDEAHTALNKIWDTLRARELVDI
jgi:hypothetical protein